MPFKINPLTGIFEYYETQATFVPAQFPLPNIDLDNYDLLNVGSINGIIYPPTGSTIVDASGVTYDNISSGLVSTDVQGAIDELNTLISGITETQDLSAVLVLGNNAGANDIDLNNNELLNVDKMSFNTATTATGGVGQLKWNNSDGTLDLGLKGGNVNLQIGQENVIRVHNYTSPAILLKEEDYQAVIVGGAVGGKLAVKLAQANSDINSFATIGIVTEDIGYDTEGFITTYGLVRK